MTAATDMDFTLGPVPDVADDIPETYTPDAPPDLPFIDLYPDATADAPFGFKANGEPYTRHHGGRGKGRKTQATVGKMPGKQAESAAALLATMNRLVGITFIAAGMPMAAVALTENNDKFEVMAREALSADPVLCRKILSVGATSGKAGLAMAYVMLGANIYPVMRDEYRANHPKGIED